MLHTPREKFSMSAHAQAWKRIVEQGETFEEATLAALLEMQSHYPVDYGTQPQIACDAHQQMAGARRFLDILTTIYQPPEKPEQIERKTLDHQAGV